ncbi:ABC transporter substrate-binding protein [Gaetbulibacter saemankumensis]|uniref:ABC transporter substrate-binding protein n=1 Tax=Gaetbulibacter saemankumensis TaxID=311208 RepID=UPI0006848313|nr:ABC transporter substrate-binding protein [Gaetbulibacter saemankumensis]
MSCRESKKEHSALESKILRSENIKYATGFSINYYENHKEIIVTSPWPKSTDTFRYIKPTSKLYFKENQEGSVIIKHPIKNLVVMSTTNIPALEYLSVDNKLVGFPGTKYISSEKTRSRIEQGDIRDLNNDLEMNMEVLLDLKPDLIIGYTVNGNNKSLNQIEKFNIPVVLDGSWTEQHPLGRAEWIKFIAAFFDKNDIADSIFNEIESNYNNAKQLALKTKKHPTVLSGSMFKDVWHVPGGNSFIAQYFKDARTNYIWKDDSSTGSLQLNLENMLEKGQTADLWIGAGSYESKRHMLSQHKGYGYFTAFKNNNIYTYTNKMGSEGGLLFYELGPLRPDYILKDIINIAHPEVLPNYTNFFFKRLE